MVPKIVLDTNVIISAVGWKGSPHQILLRCVAGDFRLPYIVTGDKHLLELSTIDEIQILSPDRFLALFPLESR